MSLTSKTLLASNRCLAARTLTRSLSTVNKPGLTANLIKQSAQIPAQASNKLSLIQIKTYSTTDSPKNEVHKKIDTMIKRDSIVVFMKGTFLHFNLESKNQFKQKFFFF
jgi:hypothetical protein